MLWNPFIPNFPGLFLAFGNFAESPVFEGIIPERSPRTGMSCKRRGNGNKNGIWNDFREKGMEQEPFSCWNLPKFQLFRGGPAVEREGGNFPCSKPFPSRKDEALLPKWHLPNRFSAPKLSRDPPVPALGQDLELLEQLGERLRESFYQHRNGDFISYSLNK